MTTTTVLVLFHGSGWPSLQFVSLAGALSERGLAHVITPDLRGHRLNPARRGEPAPTRSPRRHAVERHRVQLRLLRKGPDAR